MDAKVVSRERIAKLKAAKQAARDKASLALKTEKSEIQGDGVDRVSPAKVLEFIEGNLDLPAWRVRALWLSLILSLMLSVMNVTVISSSAAISQELNDDVADSTQLIRAYSLPYVGATLLFARMSDIFGRRRTVTTCLIMFVVASVGCGFARTMKELIFYRAAQGAAGGGLYAMSMVLLPEISSTAVVPFLSLAFGVAVAVGSFLGSFLGGVFAQSSGWPWIFWIDGAAGIFAIAVLRYACPKVVRGEALAKEAVENFDWRGCILMLVSPALLIIGIQYGSLGMFAWNSPVIISTLVLGLLSAALLIRWQFTAAKKDGRLALVLPVSIITDRVFLACLACSLCTGFVHHFIIFVLPLRFQAVNQYVPTQMAYRLLPYLGGFTTGSSLAGWVSRRLNRSFGMVLLGYASLIVGMTSLTTVSSEFVVDRKMYAFLAVTGFGTSVSATSVAYTVNLETQPQDHASAQGIMSMFRVFGGIMSIAVFNAIFNSQLQPALAGALSSSQILQIQRDQSILDLLDFRQRFTVRLLFASAFRETLWVCAGMALLGLLAGLTAYQRHPTSLAKKHKDFEELVISHARRSMGLETRSVAAAVDKAVRNHQE